MNLEDITMTVRAKTDLSKALSDPSVKAVFVYSLSVGELQIQAENTDGKPITIFLRSSIGSREKHKIDLLQYAPASIWKHSKSLMAAIRASQLRMEIQR
jgi:hypothetical protein